MGHVPLDTMVEDNLKSIYSETHLDLVAHYHPHSNSHQGIPISMLELH